MKLAQFLFASFGSRVGYKIIKSPSLDKYVNEGSVIFLCHHAGKRDQQSFVHSFLPNEKLLAISCITPSVDGAGRPTSYNRTVLLSTVDLEQALKSVLTEPPPNMPPKELSQVTLRLQLE